MRIINSGIYNFSFGARKKGTGKPPKESGLDPALVQSDDTRTYFNEGAQCAKAAVAPQISTREYTPACAPKEDAALQILTRDKNGNLVPKTRKEQAKALLMAPHTIIQGTSYSHIYSMHNGKEDENGRTPVVSKWHKGNLIFVGDDLNEKGLPRHILRYMEDGKCEEDFFDDDYHSEAAITNKYTEKDGEMVLTDADTVETEIMPEGDKTSPVKAGTKIKRHNHKALDSNGKTVRLRMIEFSENGNIISEMNASEGKFTLSDKKFGDNTVYKGRLGKRAKKVNAN